MTTNDRLCLLLRDDAGDVFDDVMWSEARDRLAGFLMADTSNAGWAQKRAEDLLTAIFTGRAASSGKQAPDGI